MRALKAPLRFNYKEVHYYSYDIGERMAEALLCYARLEREIEELEQAPMYPSVPSEQWQQRNGKGDYLYMLFGSDGSGGYLGPDGKRKVYVGNKETRIAKARALAENRQRYEQTLEKYTQLSKWINRMGSQLKWLHREVKDWPKIVE